MSGDQADYENGLLVILWSSCPTLQVPNTCSTVITVIIFR